MNGKRLLALFLCLLLCMTLFLAPRAWADFGDFSGDSDFGGGSDYDYGGSDYSSSYDDGGGSGGGSFVTFFVVLIIVIVVVTQANKGKSRQSAPRVYTNRTASAGQLRPIHEYIHIDKQFDLQAFTGKLANLYVQMQNNWQGKNIDALRPYFTDTLFAQMDRQLDALRMNHRTNYVERIAVLGVTPLGFRQSGGMDTIVVELKTRIVDYTLDDTTGKLLSGDRRREKFMTYHWELSRPSGTQTAQQAGMTTVSCPHCGAALDINQSAKCPYCDSVITLEQHDWVISAIRGISQKTV